MILEVASNYIGLFFIKVKVLLIFF